jgi:hypothetical protein
VCIKKKRVIASVLGELKSDGFRNTSKTDAMVDAPCFMFCADSPTKGCRSDSVKHFTMANSSIKETQIPRALLFLALLLTCALQSRADDFTYNGLNYTTLTDNTCETKQGSQEETGEWVSGNTASGDVVIPETAYDSAGKAYTVTAIGSYSFRSCGEMTSITIPKSVTSFGSYAFSKCSGLTKVNITDLAVWCGIPFAGTASNPLRYAHHLYLNDVEITELVIPDSVTSIGIYAFCYCTGLTSVTIPNSVTSIRNFAFEYCSELTSITIPSSVTSIGSYAFSDCSGLTSVTIPNSITSIGSSAFSNCSGLTKVNITDLAAWCGISFAYPTSNPLYYAHHLYLNDQEIRELVIPDSVTSIGSYTFSGCSGLTSIAIPSTVTSIGKEAFYDCSGLTKVNITDLAAWCGIEIGDAGANPLDCAHHLYLNDQEITELVIPDSVTSIGDYTFWNCTGLTSVTIPNSITSIGGSAFRDCAGLTKVNITDLAAWCGIKFGSLRANPLDCAHHLYLNGQEITNLVIPDSVTSIGSYTFRSCTGLTSVTIPNSVTSIGGNAFSGCSGLTSVTIPNSITSIGIAAFYNCSDCA